MYRSLTFAAVAALGLGAGACAPTTGGLTAANNPSLYSVHQPVVQRTDFVIDLATEGDRLAPSEAGRLDAWLNSIGAAYGDRISVDEAQGYGSSGARADVERVAGQHGLLLSDGAPVLNGSVPPGTIRVIASRATASVPGCPAWRHAPVFDEGNTSPNYGCATNSNLAAMVANPEDLVLGQDGSTGGSATTASRAVRTYRERQPTGRQGLPSTSPSGQSQ
ncbi:MAG TPA: CpaD family pilus assembly lipoprotein [Allosphingosinicella sp.]|nr:CpaD family pilus assembly lipoprotein [Allosphingosinicella sp.]